MNTQVYKLSNNNVDDLTLRPIVSNIGTAHMKRQNIWLVY